MQSDAKTVPEYLREIPEDRRRALTKLRRIIRRYAPEATECMKYGLPHYEQDGMLFAFASQKHYMALYVADHKLLGVFASRHRQLDIGKSCIRFRDLAALPMDDLEALLEAVAKRRRVATKARATR